ncbi:MAG: hypothetical protein ACYCVZ_16960, partial [Streptosporangiaceae bacterium]
PGGIGPGGIGQRRGRAGPDLAGPVPTAPTRTAPTRTAPTRTVPVRTGPGRSGHRECRGRARRRAEPRPVTGFRADQFRIRPLRAVQFQARLPASRHSAGAVQAPGTRAGVRARPWGRIG